MARTIGLIVLLGLSSAGCGSDSDSTEQKSCGGSGTLEITAGEYSGTSSVGTLSGSPTTSFLLLSDACTGNATGSLYSIPSAPGTYSFTTPTSGSGSSVIGPNMTLGLPGPDFTIGFDNTLQCSPCGAGSVTITESDDTHVAGTVEGTAWQITAGPGGFGTNSSSTLPVTASFHATWN